MLIKEQRVKGKWSNATAKYYLDFGYPKIKQGQIFEVMLEHLPLNSNMKIKILCDICQNETYEISYNNFNRKKMDVDICKKCSSSIDYECDFCGKGIKVERGLLNRHKYHFCNSKCYHGYKKKFGSFNNTREKRNCDYCNEEIEVKQYVLKELKEGKRKNIFCSVDCKGKWESDYKIGKNNPNYNQIEKICEYCENGYTVPLNQNERTHYCSVECRQKGQRTRIKKECINCGEEFERSPSQINNNKSGIFYCSQECFNEYKIKTHRENRNCEQCNEEYETKTNSSQRFCCMECQGKWQSEYLVGENASGFNSDIPLSERYVSCDWCNEETLVKTPQKLKQIKEEGAKHFCSVKCKTEWFTKEWSQSEEWKLESSERAVKMLEDGVFGIESEAQRVINRFLDDLKIGYTNEYNCKYVSIDNHLTEYNLMIEVMGTYWHSDPRFYKEINYQMQVDRIKNDKIKSTYIRNNYGMNILYIWEEDILNNEKLCKRLINEYIDNCGILKNYHSFNYYLNNKGNLLLIDEKITPYMEYDIEELRPIINITGSKRRSMKQPDRWVTFNCDNCGDKKEQLIKDYNKSKNHFCSTECAHEFRKGKPRNLVI